MKEFEAANGNLYLLIENANECAAVTTIQTMDEQKSNYELWHCRLGHLGMDNVKQMHDKELVNNMKCVKRAINRDCEACIKGKMTRKPFPKDGNNQTREILERIHSDVCGPMPIESLAGSK